MWAKIRTAVLFAAGSLCLTLGIIGIFLPLLPTTPFLLLAAACFFRSSERLYRWLIGHRLFGKSIRGFRRFHAISARAKIVSILLLWATIVLSAMFVVGLLCVRVVLFVIAAAVSAYILRLRTLTKSMAEDVGANEPPA